MTNPTYTVELPAHLSAAEFTDRLERIASPDWFADWWHIGDVTECCDWDEIDITDEDAREVLRLAHKYYDSSNGINWEVLQSWVDHIIEQKQKAA
jgi:hypothetical protein